MTTKFIVVDHSTYPHQAAAVEFEDDNSLKQYLTDYGIKYKRVYTVKEMTGKFSCSLWSN